MSLPPLVMVVWAWPLVHVTICALLGSPEASNVARSQISTPSSVLTARHPLMQLDVLIHCMAFDSALISAYVLFNTSMLNIPHPPDLFPPSCCASSPLLSFSPWLCSRVARRKGAGQGEAQTQRWLIYDFWRGNTAQAMRECGNVRMARCPWGQAHSALCLEAAFLLVPGGWGDERGHQEGGGLVGGHRPGIKHQRGSGGWW